MAPHGDDASPYHPVDAIKAGMQGAAILGAAGLFTASIQNSMRAENVGMMGVFTKSGGVIFNFAIVGGSYEFTKTAAANLRTTDDHYNAAIGGLVAGSILGLRSGRMAPMLGCGVFTSVALATWDYTGGLAGIRPEIDGMDDLERREAIRKNRRRPIEETLAVIGEGRGIQPPGFRERRKERLEAKYGVKIEPVSALAE